MLSIENHENGMRHKANVQKRLSDLRKKAKDEDKAKQKLDQSLQTINDVSRSTIICFKLAFMGMLKDIAQDPSVAKRYGINVTADLQKQISERLTDERKLESASSVNEKKKKQAKPSKSKPKVAPPTQPLPKLEWQEVKTEDGEVYYWNMVKNVTQWHKPDAPVKSDCSRISEKSRLDQFVFNKLVELSESGSTAASEAVHKAFNAPIPEDSDSTDPVVLNNQHVEVEESSGPHLCFMEDFEQPFKKISKIGLLGEWKSVIPEPPASLPKLDLPWQREAARHAKLRVKRAKELGIPVCQLPPSPPPEESSPRPSEHHAATVIGRLQALSEASIYGYLLSNEASHFPEVDLFTGEKTVPPGSLAGSKWLKEHRIQDAKAEVPVQTNREIKLDEDATEQKPIPLPLASIPKCVFRKRHITSASRNPRTTKID
ncbi:unnamed protein product [Protopolystoma xenopodis]|uniref:WW domain-containing protein n=1 Tax=Protopolystoma xenopodis TaxID=117903 RepID=A0A3S5BFJ4_9PLAT|nr:unnamed protein product [Protopolystoma xenopodis]